MRCIVKRLMPIVITIIVLVLIMQKKGMRILNFMGNSSKKLLVHYEMDEIEVKGSIDIVLTPQRVVKLVTLQPTQEEELWVRYFCDE